MLRVAAGVALAALISGCANAPGISNGGDDDLAPFDPSQVIYADGCVPVPEAQACVDANPRTFQLPDADRAAEQCRELGYTCCDPETWISSAAASCIAETDARMSERYDNRITVSCYDDVFGPMYNVYENAPEAFIGVGVHAATGRITWFDDGSGVFS